MEMTSSHDLIRPDLVREKYGDATNLAYNEYIRSRIANGDEIYHFGFGQSPFPLMEEACQALIKHVHRSEYLAVQGIPELRKAICSFHQHFDKVTFDPANVIVSPGSKELIFLLMTIFNGDVLMNSPSWTTYKPQAILAHKSPLVISSSEAEGWKVTPTNLVKALEQSHEKHNKLLIFTNSCNPTGVGYTDQELKALSDVFRKHKVLVLSDEIYARLNFQRKHICLAKHYPEGTILSSGMSKWASAGGWRVGYCIFPKELQPLLSKLKSAASHSYSCAAAPMQFASAEIFQNLNSCDDYIQHCTRVLHNVATFTLRQLRGVGVTVAEPCGGYYCFPNFELIRSALARRGADTGQKMCDVILRDVAVALLPGGPDNLRPSTELTVRLCFVDFDGKVALAESKRIGLDTGLSDDFTEKFCPPVFKGITALTKWVITLTQEQLTAEQSQ